MRASGLQFLIREFDGEPPRIVFLHFRVGVAEGRPIAIARDIHRPHVKPRIPLGDPIGQRQTNTPALAEARHNPAG